MENANFRKTSLILQDALDAKSSLACLSDEKLTLGLIKMADALIESKAEILKANALDEQKAKEIGKISSVMLDRLHLNGDRIDAMAKGIRDVAKLPSPLGKVLYSNTRPNGLKIERISVPFGVIGIIYESRPNVTSDACALCIKSGNVCVLRSGKDAFLSAYAIVKAMKKGLADANIDPDAVNLIEDTSRESANELMKAVGYIDLLIPRGGKGLISSCIENAKVPCVQTGTGICHIYVDEKADEDMALNIIENAKTSRPSVCNALEVCLVNEKIAGDFLPKLYERLCVAREKKNLCKVELRCDEKAYSIIGKENCVLASKDDFDTEFLDYILAIKVVPSVEKAVEHIAKHSTHHSEAIITESTENANVFVSKVDSAAVYVNASTRFTDGGEFGFGCEMGISTQKNHPRGPMGLTELTTYKYVISGNGQVR